MAYITPNTQADDLRHLVLEASYRSVGYLHKEVLAALGAYPLKLCLGDIADNLRCLRDSRDTITDDTTQKLINLLDAGWPTEKLVAAIDFMNDMPCITDLVEQGHGSGAALMLQHKRYSERTLRCRSVIHQCRPLVYPSPFDKQMMRLEKELSKQQARQPKASAFQAFFSAMASAVAVEVRTPGLSSFERQQEVLRRCRGVFGALSRHDQQFWEARARARKAHAEEERSAMCDMLRGEMQLQRRRREEWVATVGVPNHIDSCRLGPGGLRHLVETGNALSPAAVATLQKTASESTPLPSEEMQSVLLVAAERFQNIASPSPWWAPHLALNRDLFLGIALCVGGRDPPVAWMFMLATQKPMCIVFVRLSRRHRTLPDYEMAGALDAQPVHRLEFDVLPWAFADDRSIPIDPDEDMFVLRGLRFSGKAVCTNHLPELFEDFTRHHPAPESGHSGNTRPTRAKPVKPRRDRERG